MAQPLHIIFADILFRSREAVGLNLFVMSSIHRSKLPGRHLEIEMHYSGGIILLYGCACPWLSGFF